MSRTLFSHLGSVERSRVTGLLRTETTGGLLLLAAALAALVWANWPESDSYARFVSTSFGPDGLHLDLTVAEWAGDGLLAVFFFAAGLELKREFVAGDLRDPQRAVLPVIAAVGGMAVPILIFALVNLGGTDGALRGWAIPSATDIAFALAVLAVISTHLPTGLRTFLLTLAVVDDLLAIVVIACFYGHDLSFGWFGLALVPIAAFGVLVQRRRALWWLLIPLAVVAWTLVHASGIHATVAGVLLAFTVPVRGGGELAARVEHHVRPMSSLVAVPLFALFSAGVALGGWHGVADALGSRITLGVAAGLVAGKTIGIFGTTWLTARFTRAELDEGLAWADIAGVAMLGGIGFTVSLLVGELAYGQGSERDGLAKVGVLVGSLVAALLASVVLGARNRAYRRLESTEDATAS